MRMPLIPSQMFNYRRVVLLSFMKISKLSNEDKDKHRHHHHRHPIHLGKYRRVANAGRDHQAQIDIIVNLVHLPIIKIIHLTIAIVQSQDRHSDDIHLGHHWPHDGIVQDPDHRYLAPISKRMCIARNDVVQCQIDVQIIHRQSIDMDNVHGVLIHHHSSMVCMVEENLVHHVSMSQTRVGVIEHDRQMLQM